MSYSVLIVGLGQIGMGYDLTLNVEVAIFSHARAFQQHPDFSLIGGVDIDVQKRWIFEQHYQAPSFETLAAALEHQQPDIIVLAVPTILHGELFLQVLKQAKPRIILCEKPLAYDLKEARYMVEMCQEKNIQLYVNYMRRASPGAIEIKRRLDSGEIKSPIKGIAWYSKGFLHNGSHLFNLLQYWLGEYEVAKPLTMGRGCSLEDKEIDVYVEFEHGSVTFLSAWEEAFSHFTVELLSPSGRLRYEHEGRDVTWAGVTPDTDFAGYTILSDDAECIPSGMAQSQWHVVQAIAQVLAGQNTSLSSGTDALYTLTSMQGILNELC